MWSLNGGIHGVLMLGYGYGCGYVLGKILRYEWGYVWGDDDVIARLKTLPQG